MIDRRGTAAFAALFLFAVLTASLSAHLAVVKTSPGKDQTLDRPPPQVQVWFNQPPSERVSRLELHGPDGEVALAELRVNREDRSISAAVTGAPGAGRYEVRWRTAGNDGHVMRGTFAFSIASKE